MVMAMEDKEFYKVGELVVKTNISIRILLVIFLYFSRAWMKITLCNSSLPCLNKVLLLLLLSL